MQEEIPPVDPHASKPMGTPDALELLHALTEEYAAATEAGRLHEAVRTGADCYKAVTSISPRTGGLTPIVDRLLYLSKQLPDLRVAHRFAQIRLRLAMLYADFTLRFEEHPVQVPHLNQLSILSLRVFDYRDAASSQRRAMELLRLNREMIESAVFLQLRQDAHCAGGLLSLALGDIEEAAENFILALADAEDHLPINSRGGYSWKDDYLLSPLPPTAKGRPPGSLPEDEWQAVARCRTVIARHHANIADVTRLSGDIARGHAQYLKALDNLSKTMPRRDATHFTNWVAAVIEGDKAEPKDGSHLLSLLATCGDPPWAIAVCLDSLEGLAKVAADSGDTGRSCSLLGCSYQARAQHFGPTAPETQRALRDLALQEAAEGARSLARKHIDQCIGALSEVWNSSDWWTSEVAYADALISLDAGDEQRAQERALSAAKRSTMLIRSLIPLISRSGQLEALTSRRNHIDLCLTLAVRAGQKDPSLTAEVYETLALNSALLHEYFIATRFQSKPDDFPEYGWTRQIETLRGLEAQIGELAFRHAQGYDDGSELSELIDMRDEILQQVRLSDRRVVDLKKVQEALLNEEKRLLRNVALIHYVKYSVHRGNSSYAAFLIRSSGEIRLCTLASALCVDALVSRFRERVTGLSDGELGKPRSGFVSWVGAYFASPDIDLYKAVVRPLITDAAEGSCVLIIPDAELCKVPMQSLRRSRRRFVNDAYSVSYIASVGDLLWEDRLSGPTTTPLVCGDPSFDLAEANDVQGISKAGRIPMSNRSMPTQGTVANRLPSWKSFRALRPLTTRSYRTCRFDVTGRWPALPGTRHEAVEVAKLLGVQPRLGPEATKAAVVRVVGPQVLHLATHGFFLQPAVTEGPGARVRSSWPAARVDPMATTGLALAGANDSPTAIRDGLGNGIITAQEVTQMDLRGTSLVVLSACDTGLGYVGGGQAAVGLGLAFRVVGADAVVMSLLKVQDSATSDLMCLLY
jgi:CHAT domain-containing protein